MQQQVKVLILSSAIKSWSSAKLRGQKELDTATMMLNDCLAYLQKQVRELTPCSRRPGRLFPACVLMTFGLSQQVRGLTLSSANESGSSAKLRGSK